MSSVVPLWKVFEPVAFFFRSGETSNLDTSRAALWMALFGFLVLLLVLVTSLRRVTSTQLRKPLGMGWALNGAGRRITLEKIEAERCPVCGGKMRYRNKVTQWIDHREPNGRKWRETLDQVPALICVRNPKHWAEIDPAEDAET